MSPRFTIADALPLARAGLDAAGMRERTARVRLSTPQVGARLRPTGLRVPAFRDPRERDGRATGT